MSLKIDTSRALRTHRELHGLVHAVEQATAEDESEWLEWKSRLDLGAKSTKAMLARHIIGMANRPVDEAKRFVEGFGYILVGLEPGNRCGIDRVDFADLRAGISSYLGSHGPTWTARYHDEVDSSVLIIIVDPPRYGDPIHTLQRDFERYHAGDIFVRKLGSTEKANPADVEVLTQRKSRRPGLRWTGLMSHRNKVITVLAACISVVVVAVLLYRIRSSGNRPIADPPAPNCPAMAKLAASSPPGRSPSGVPRATYAGSITNPKYFPSSISFSPDGNTLATTTADQGSVRGTLYLWNVKTRKVAYFPDPAGGPLYSLAYEPDGKALAVGDGDGTTWLWNIQTRKHTALTNPRKRPLSAVAYAPGGRILAVGYENAIWLWDTSSGKVDAKINLSIGSGLIGSVAFNPAGTVLAVGYSDGNIYLWHIDWTLR